MSDRLEDLRRQRTLVEQQLAWLDAEIAAEAARVANVNAASSALPRPRPASPIESISLTSDPHPADAEAIIKHYTAENQSAEAQTRRGCWTVFALAFVALILAVGSWYVLRSR